MKSRTLVVVASGHVAKIFDWRDGALQHRDDLEPVDLDDDGPSGKRPPEASERDTDEATFAKQLAHWLYSKAHRGDFEKLVLIADPTTLGTLRPQLHSEVSNRIVLELDKTLINSPVDDIARHIKREL